MFIDSSDRVTMSNNDNILAGHDMRADSIIPIRKYSIYSQFQRLSSGENIFWDMSISGINLRVSLVIAVKFRRWDIVTSSPN